MTVTDPASLLKDIDIEFFNNYRRKSTELPQVSFVEPGLGKAATVASQTANEPTSETSSPESIGQITSRVVVLGDNIDTDAVSYVQNLTKDDG